MSSEYKRVRDYELMVIFHPELSEEDLASEISKVEGHISAAEGAIKLINRETPWGRRRLSYAIRHDSRDIRDGVYVLYYFASDSSRLAEMEREIKLQDRILRYLLTQQVAPIMEPEAPEEEGAAETTPAADAPTAEPAAAATEALATEAAEAPATEAAPVENTATAAVEESAPEDKAAAAGEEATAGADEAAAPAEDAATASEDGAAEETK